MTHHPTHTQVDRERMQKLARMIDLKMDREQQEDYIWALQVVMGEEFYEQWPEKLRIARAVASNKLGDYLRRRGFNAEAQLWEEYRNGRD